MRSMLDPAADTKDRPSLVTRKYPTDVPRGREPAAIARRSSSFVQSKRDQVISYPGEDVAVARDLSTSLTPAQLIAPPKIVGVSNEPPGARKSVCHASWPVVVLNA
jgi:hypothetical protein